MKTSMIITCLFFFFACSEKEEPEPTPPFQADIFIGTWSYESPNGKVRLLNFTVDKEGGEYIFSNIQIESSEFSTSGYSYTVEIADKFAMGDGFGKVKINGGDDVSWISIHLYYCKLTASATKYIMYVDEVRLYRINRTTIELQNQTLTRI